MDRNEMIYNVEKENVRDFCIYCAHAIMCKVHNAANEKCV